VTLFAYDGASPFDLDAAKAHSGIVITGYIVGRPGGFNPIDKARVDTVRAKGMGFSPNWERAADFFLTCSLADAKAAGVEALAANRALGLPDDGSIRCSFSIDAPVPTSRFGEMGQKLNAVTAGLAGHYQTMLYGQSNLIDWLCANRYLSGKHWLMGSTWNQPYNPASPNVCMVQSHDAAGNWINSPVPGTDINTITDPYATGAWFPDGSPYSGGFSVSDVQTILSAISGLGTILEGGIVPGKVDDDPGHVSLRDIARMIGDLPTNTELTTALQNIKTGNVTLTDVQMQTLADDIVAALTPAQSKQLLGDLANAITKGIAP
jgi:hypothetical protein